MKNVINARNATRDRRPELVWGHTTALGPMLGVHGAYQYEVMCRDGRQRLPGGWCWHEAATLECLGTAWNMTGRWQARRAVTVSRNAFDKRLMKVVPRLAKYLNGRQVSCLRDFEAMEPSPYRKVVEKIHWAVRDISRLRRTTEVEPVLGSKVLHHFFPSLVPVFDAQYVRHGIMRRTDFREFVAEDPDGWLVFADARQAGGPRMLDFHRYFAYCAAQIGTASMLRLAATRKVFAEGFRAVAPCALYADRSSLLWKLDAKAVEYCLLGAT
jgi:hypothetical protein